MHYCILYILRLVVLTLITVCRQENVFYELKVDCVYFRHYRYEQKLACLLWKIDMRDVTIIPTETAEATSKSMVSFFVLGAVT
jgi:guanylate cyclase